MLYKHFFHGKDWMLAAFLIFGSVATFFALNNYIYQEKQEPTTFSTNYRGTLSGEYVCLPHKETGGVQTMECALGIKTDAGEYYALDFNLMPQAMMTLKTGDNFTAAGLITPTEMLSSNHWRTYPIVGIFSVTNSLEVK